MLRPFSAFRGRTLFLSYRDTAENIFSGGEFILPSAKVLEQKKQIVENLVARLNAACAGVIVDYKGITVTDDTALRKELREAGVEYTVVKNTLLRLAIKETELNGLESVLDGTISPT